MTAKLNPKGKTLLILKYQFHGTLVENVFLDNIQGLRNLDCLGSSFGI